MTASLAAGVLFSVSVSAQAERHSPEERAKRITDSLKTSLSLTDDQYAKVYQLNVEYINKMRDLRKDDRDQRKEQVKELRKSQVKDLSAILSKDQMEKLKSLRKEQGQNWKGHHRNMKQSS